LKTVKGFCCLMQEIKNGIDRTHLKIEKEIRDYEIKLDNGLEMTFDLKGNLIDIDD
ncbi:PepSY-like domain-containing protein, partial [Parabacteroides distasonis]